MLVLRLDQNKIRLRSRARLTGKNLEDLRITSDYPRLIQSLEECEFKSLLQEVRDEAARAGRQVQGGPL